MKINIDNNQNFSFELVLQVRDRLGNPTGKKKYYGSNNGNDLATFYNKNCIFEYIGNGIYKIKGKKRGRK
jgi:hypothetical protein